MALASPGAAHSGAHVTLVVDDVSDIRELLSYTLEIADDDRSRLGDRNPALDPPQQHARQQ